MRFEPRLNPSPALLLAAPVAAVLASLAIGSLLIAATRAPVGQAFVLLLQGALGSRFALTETLTRATPLILTGLSAAVAFRARLWNIGAEGQLMLGALMAVAIGGAPNLLGVESPEGLWLPVMALGGMAAGALWLALPTLARLAIGVDEVVTTLLLNFVAVLLVSMLLDGPMKDPLALGWPQSVAIAPALELGKLVERSRLHTGLVWALVATAVVWTIQSRTTFGQAMRAVGANARAAKFAGVPVGMTVLLTALMSGALAGLAGVAEVAGRAGYVTLDMSPGYGYSGIVIAMLAGLHPAGVVLAAVFVAAIMVGADSMSRALGVPSYLADVMVAVALLAMLVSTMLARYRLRRD
ncbi:ABC transporter permease [Derxia gummosa]|uniref:ABC transporter permease n=1 Tax=Derxia gummosa DSM 723 TaxID=1121388 RepID=A0A8B6X747_9BURK|nr:ABC transporter permease [Derxia gummosa]